MGEVGLTRRRREVLRRLVALSREAGGPVHYTALAERLGVSKWAAYEVLRALEAEGYVRSSYGGKRGRAGRPEVLFEPTGRGIEAVEPRPLPDRVRAEWAKLKGRILRRLSEGGRNYLDMLREARRQREALPFCACVLGALVAGASAKGGSVLDQVANFLRQGREEWALFVAAGMLVAATARRGLSRLLARFQEGVERVGAEGRRALLEFLSEAVKAVREGSEAR